jgi:hypothetical protein
MNKSLSVDLLLYGGMLIGLSILAHHLFPNGVATTLWIDIAGGATSVLLGGLGLRGYSVRRWAIGVMVILSIVLLAQTVSGWLAVKAGVEAAKSAAMIPSLLFVFGIGQLANLIQNRSGLPFSADKKPRDPTNENK